MPEVTQTAFNTFVGGLVTEAGALTFPPEASIDELNCDLRKDGSRRRRLGLAYEDSAEQSVETVSADLTVSTHVWRNVGEEEGVNYVVIQLGEKVFFYEQTDGALSANRVTESRELGTPYSLDLSDFVRPGGDARKGLIDVANISGALVIVSPEINSLLIERDIVTGEFTATQIEFLIRDYEWQGEQELYVEPGQKTTEREYDSLNAGWTRTNLDAYYNNRTATEAQQQAVAAAIKAWITGQPATVAPAVGENLYPPLTHPWYSGKDSNGNFSLAEFDKVYAGNSLITNGHFILNLYTGDRQLVSDIEGVPSSPENSRFSTVATYAGRVFYSGLSESTANNGSKIFFSQILESGFSRIGTLHQSNDPTSEEISDLLDTDGGFITIPEAVNIRKLHVFGPNLYVMAENGVWQISGVDDVFRATEYIVSKVSEEGIVERGTFVSAQGRPYWWANTGIFTLQASQVGDIGAVNITQATIQTFFNNISPDKRADVRGAYDDLNQRVVWLYPEESESVTNKRNRLLLFDEGLSAFFPWAVQDMDSNTHYLVDIAPAPGTNTIQQSVVIEDNNGNDITDEADVDVTVARTNRNLTSAGLKFLAVHGTDNTLSFAEFNDITFKDWGDNDATCYADAAYNFMGDLETRKSSPYITTFCKRTETGWEETGSGYELVRTSSLKVSVYWDFKNIPASAAQEVYRLKYPLVVDPGDLSNVDYPQDTIITRIKPRGRGRVMRVRFEAQEGKDFHLLGWNVIGYKAGRF